MEPRLIDATVTECILAARTPVDRTVLPELAGCTTIVGCRSAVPVLPVGAYGAEALDPLAATAPVLEPLTWDAHAQAMARDRDEAWIVDPEGVPLGHPSVAFDLRQGWVRERVAWLPDAPVDLARLDAAFADMPQGDRLRLRDPHGTLTPDTIDLILDHPHAGRLTLVLEDARGLALATAIRALAAPRGPAVRTTLLGLGPRTGLPPTELLIPRPDDAVRHVAERAALVAGVPIPPQHPLWGSRRHEIGEPERLHARSAEAVPRWNPATLQVLLEERLEELGIGGDPARTARLAAALGARLRPGEALDGPTLYAFLATHLDLTRVAQESPERKR